MKNKIFRRKVKETLYYIRSYGLERSKEIKEAFNNRKSPNEDEIIDFISNVHKGFYFAQDNILIGLLEILSEKKAVREALSKSRQNKSKDEIETLSKNISQLNYQEKVYRNLADTIAWQLFNDDITTIRRLDAGKPLIDITSSNIESCIAFIEEKKKELKNFALISDLTTCVQVGDIVYRDYDNKRVNIIELKEGKTNKEIMNILTEFFDNGCEYFLHKSLEGKNENFVNHFNRNFQQIKHMSNTAKIINTGKGIDSKTDAPISVIQDPIVVSSFEDRLVSLIKSLNAKKSYAIDIIDECLFIGVYDATRISPKIFELWISKYEKMTSIYDFRSSLYDGTCRPIFMNALIQDKYQLSIVFGEIVILFSLNIDLWLDNFKKIGGDYRWLSINETRKMNAEKKQSEKITEINSQGLLFIVDGKEMFFVDGILVRIFASLTSPNDALKIVKRLCSIEL